MNRVFRSMPRAWRAAIVGALLSPVCPAVCPAVAQTESAPRLRRAVCVPIAAFAGAFGAESPWSPAGELLAFYGPQVYVFDAARPAQPPRVLLRVPASGFRWSPDGRWLLCRTLPEAQGTVRAGLVAVPATEAAAMPPEPLCGDVEFHDFVWASNGYIYYWEESTGARHRLDPPAAWRADNPGPFPARPYLLGGAAPGRDGAEPHLFTVEPAEREVVLTALVSPEVEWVLPEDVFPDGRRLLVRVLGGTGGETRIIDLEGTTLARLGVQGPSERFAGTSVSADGRYVAGFVDRDEGDALRSSKLYLTDTAGRWRLRIQGVAAGLHPKLARAGSLLAYEDPDSGRVYVGKLEIAPR